METFYYTLTNTDGLTVAIIQDGEEFSSLLQLAISGDQSGQKLVFDDDTLERKAGNIGEFTVQVTDENNTSTFTYYLSRTPFYAPKPSPVITEVQAKEALEALGFFTANLWHIDDVKNNYVCDDDTAYQVLSEAMTNDSTMIHINETIDYYAQEYELESKGA